MTTKKDYSPEDLIAVFSKSKLIEMEFESGDYKIKLKKENNGVIKYENKKKYDDDDDLFYSSEI